MIFRNLKIVSYSFFISQSLSLVYMAQKNGDYTSLNDFIKLEQNDFKDGNQLLMKNSELYYDYSIGR